MILSQQCRVRALLPCVMGAFCLSVLPLSAALSATPAGAARRNSPDAFLPIPATNLESILEQVQSNPAVRRHYARYFHLPQSRVASYLRTNLIPSRLSHSGLYTVYFVRANGLIYPTLLTVPAGSPVFALRNGPPVLTWNEGNPLTRTRKAVPLNAAAPPPPPPAAPADQPPPMQVVVPNQVETTVVPPTTSPQGTPPEADSGTPPTAGIPQ